MDQQAMIEHLRWWSQVYFWLAIGVPILGAIAGGLLNMKRQHIEGQLRELKEHLTQAELDALRTQSQDLQQHVVEARQRQADAERELREVQAHQRARTLTLEQVQALVQRLRVGPKGKVRVDVLDGDPEAYQFGEQFAKVLKIAGWPLEGIASKQVLFTAPSVGLQLGASPARMPPHGEFLLQALRDVGLEVSDTAPILEPKELVYLVVGAQPRPRPTP